MHILRSEPFLSRSTCSRRTDIGSTRPRRPCLVQRIKSLFDIPASKLHHALTSRALHARRSRIPSMNFHPGHPKTDRRFAPLRLLLCSRLLDRVDVAEQQDRNDLLGQLADKHRFALLGKSLNGIGKTKALHQRLPVRVMFAYDSRDTQ